MVHSTLNLITEALRLLQRWEIGGFYAMSLMVQRALLDRFGKLTTGKLLAEDVWLELPVLK